MNVQNLLRDCYANPLSSLRKCDMFSAISNAAIGTMQTGAQIGSTIMQNKRERDIAEQTNATNAAIAEQTNATNAANVEATNEANIAINDATNAMNKRIADEANALNYQMFQEQNDWNENMWNKQNEYNDPSAQMARLIAAGINPNMVAGNSASSGTSDNLAQSAQWNGAEVAHMNPVMLESPHAESYKIEPYHVARVNADFLPALAMAAGVSKTQAETEGMQLKNSFDADTYGTREEMEIARTKFVAEQLKDFVSAGDYRKSVRGFEVVGKQLYNKYMELTNKEIETKIQQRIDEWKWSKSLRPEQKQKLVAEINSINKSIEKMDADMLLNKAQERHWLSSEAIERSRVAVESARNEIMRQDVNNRGELYHSEALKNNADIKLIRAKEATERVDQAFKSYGLNPSNRHQLAEALVHMGLDSSGKFVDGLEGAANGQYDLYFQEFMKVLRQLMRVGGK